MTKYSRLPLDGGGKPSLRGGRARFQRTMGPIFLLIVGAAFVTLILSQSGSFRNHRFGGLPPKVPLSEDEPWPTFDVLMKDRDPFAIVADDLKSEGNSTQQQLFVVESDVDKKDALREKNLKEERDAILFSGGSSSGASLSSSSRGVAQTVSSHKSDSKSNVDRLEPGSRRNALKKSQKGHKHSKEKEHSSKSKSPSISPAETTQSHPAELTSNPTDPPHVAAYVDKKTHDLSKIGKVGKHVETKVVEVLASVETEPPRPVGVEGEKHASSGAVDEPDGVTTKRDEENESASAPAEGEKEREEDSKEEREEEEKREEEYRQAEQAESKEMEQDLQMDSWLLRDVRWTVDSVSYKSLAQYRAINEASASLILPSLLPSNADPQPQARVHILNGFSEALAAWTDLQNNNRKLVTLIRFDASPAIDIPHGLFYPNTPPTPAAASEIGGDSSMTFVAFGMNLVHRVIWVYPDWVSPPMGDGIFTTRVGSSRATLEYCYTQWLKITSEGTVPIEYGPGRRCDDADPYDIAFEIILAVSSLEALPSTVKVLEAERDEIRIDVGYEFFESQNSIFHLLKSLDLPPPVIESFVEKIGYLNAAYCGAHSGAVPAKLVQRVRSLIVCDGKAEVAAVVEEFKNYWCDGKREAATESLSQFECMLHNDFIPRGDNEEIVRAQISWQAYGLAGFIVRSPTNLFLNYQPIKGLHTGVSLSSFENIFSEFAVTIASLDSFLSDKFLTFFFLRRQSAGGRVPNESMAKIEWGVISGIQNAVENRAIDIRWANGLTPLLRPSALCDPRPEKPCKI